MDVAGVAKRRRCKKKRKTTDATATLPDDVVLEILGRVDDGAALFRCAVTCKRWRGLVSDPAFLRGRWPDRSSLLFGFFAQHRRYRPRNVSADPLPGGARSPAFVPVPHSPLGPARRSLASFLVLPSLDDLDDAEPLVARHGLLLVRLFPRPRAGAPVSRGQTVVHLAVCDLLAGTCDVLPALKCRASSSVNSCTILTDADSCSHGRSPSSPSPSFFKVLALVFNRFSENYYLCTYSSAERSWSTPATSMALEVRGGTGSAVVCQGMASWLVTDGRDFYTLDVGVEDGQVFFTHLPVPQGQDVSDIKLLSVAIDGTLSMLLLGTLCCYLEIWTLQGGGQESVGDVDDDGGKIDWLRTKVVELKPPKREHTMCLCVGERSSTLLAMDNLQNVYFVDIEAATVDEVTEQFRRLNVRTAVPFEVDWPAFFLSRLEGPRVKVRENT